MGKRKLTEDAHMWFLFYCEEDESYSIVDNNAVPNWEVVKEKDTSVFFYSSKSYIGEVQMRNVDRDALDSELKKKGKKAKRVSKVKSGPPASKRLVTAPKRFSPSESSSPIKTNKRRKSEKTVMKEIKEAGQKAMSQEVLQLGGSIMAETESDSNLKNTAESDSDDCQMLSMPREKKENRKDRQTLISQIRQIQDAPRTSASTSCGLLEESPVLTKHAQEVSKSPSKEELKRMLLEAEEKLSMINEEPKKEPEKMASPEKLSMSTSKESFRKMSSANNVSDSGHASDGESSKTLQSIGCDDDTLDEDNSTKEHGFESDTFQSDSLGEDKGSKDHDYDSDTLRSDILNEKKGIDDQSFDSDTSDQLFGKHSGVPMVHLSNNIFCKKECVAKALLQSSKGTQLARRLLSGVFKLEAIVTCTLTGQKPRAAGKTNYGEDVTGLDPNAVKAILQFTKAIGKTRNWEKFDEEKVKQALTQRVGELTRSYNAKQEAKAK